MRKFIKQMACTMALALTVSSLAVAAPADAATSLIKLTRTSKGLYVGGAKGTGLAEDGTEIKAKVSGTYKLRGAIQGLDKTKYYLRFSTDDKAVATVRSTDSTITAVGKGKTNINIFIRNKKTKKTVETVKFPVTVRKNNETPLEITNKPETGRVGVGEKVYDLDAKWDETSSDLASWKIVSGADVAAIDADGVITTKKAGKFSVQAYTYQSAEYNQPTAVSEVLALEAGSGIASVKATGTRTLVATFDSNMTTLLDKNEIKVFTKVGETVENPVTVEKTEVDKTDATGKTVKISVYADFKSDTNYFIRYGEKDKAAELGFTVSKIAATDVASIVMNTKEVEVNNATYTDLDFSLLNADGLDLTGAYKTYVSFALESNSNATLDGSKILFTEVGKTANVIATYTYFYTENNESKKHEIKQTFAITSIPEVKAQYSVSEWAVVPVDAAYDKKVNSVALNEEKANLVVKMKSSKDSTIYVVGELGKELENYYIESTDSKRLLIDKTADGTFELVPNGTGAVPVLVKDNNGVVVDGFNVTVNDARKVGTVALSYEKQTMNVADEQRDKDNITAVVTVKDQSGVPLKGTSISLTGKTTEAKATQYLISNESKTDAAGKAIITISADDVERTSTSKLNVSGSTAVTVKYEVKAQYKDTTAKTQELNFRAMNVADTKITKYNLVAPKNEYDTAISSTSKKEEFVSELRVIGTNVGGYFIADYTDSVVSTQAGAKNKVSAGNVGATDIAFTVKVNSKPILEVFNKGGMITTVASPTDINFAYVSGSTDTEIKKIAKGDYTFTLVGYVSNSGPKDIPSSQMGTTKIKVVDNQVALNYDVLAKTVASTEVYDVINAFKVTDGKAASYDISDVDYTKSSTTAYVKNLKVQVPVTAFGNSGTHYVQTVPIKDGGITLIKE